MILHLLKMCKFVVLIEKYCHKTVQGECSADSFDNVPFLFWHESINFRVSETPFGFRFRCYAKSLFVINSSNCNKCLCMTSCSKIFLYCNHECTTKLYLYLVQPHGEHSMHQSVENNAVKTHGNNGKRIGVYIGIVFFQQWKTRWKTKEFCWLGHFQDPQKWLNGCWKCTTSKFWLEKGKCKKVSWVCKFMRTYILDYTCTIAHTVS